jgi:Domain of unknown function (DUF5134)
MGAPVLMQWLFTMVFLGVALICAVRAWIGTGRGGIRPGARGGFGRDVDVAHTVMGLGMAAMFSPWGDPVAVPVWATAFGAVGVWFAVRFVRARRAQAGDAVAAGHSAGDGHGRAWLRHHVLEAPAMVFMALAMSTGHSSASASTSALSASPGRARTAGDAAPMAGMNMTSGWSGPLVSLIAFLLLLYFGVFVLWSAAELVRMLRNPVAMTAGPGGSGGSGGSAAAVRPVTRAMLSPEQAVLVQTVTGMGMTYMFSLMI